MHLVGCLYYLYQLWTVKQISGNEIYLLIKYIKSVLWRVAKCLSYTEEARCLKVKRSLYIPCSDSVKRRNKLAPQIDAWLAELHLVLWTVTGGGGRWQRVGRAVRGSAFVEAGNLTERVMEIVFWNFWIYTKERGPGNLSRYSDSLRAGRSGFRIPVGGETFSAPIQTGTRAHTSLLYNGYRVFLGVKAAAAWRWQPTPPRLKKEKSYNSTPRLCLRGQL